MWPEAIVRPGSDDNSARKVFEILVNEHADMLECYLRALLPSGSSIDDLFQETFLVAWRRLADYDRSRPFAAWLRGIAHTLVIAHARKRARNPLTTDPSVLAELDIRFDRLATAPGDSFRERAERLLECVSRLPQSMREAIDLVYTRSMTIAAAALSTGESEELLKKRVQRARHMLAMCLGVGKENA